MPSIKFSESSIAKIKAPDPSGSQRLFWDKELRGFGVLASGVTNNKSYIVRRALPSRGTRRVTIGSTNVLALTLVGALFISGTSESQAARAFVAAKVA